MYILQIVAIYIFRLTIMENKGLLRKKTIKPRKKKLTKIDMLKSLKTF